MKRKLLGTPSGFRDLLPEDANTKNWLVKTISEVYKKWGFLPIETPIVEFTETLAGEVTDFNLFSVVPSKERQTGSAKSLSLRFDHTVPLARFVIENTDKIAIPFKRYTYGSLFRGETAQVERGRFRQFDQLDIDTVGSSNIASDIEILLCMRDAMKAVLKNDNFIIHVNTRKLLNCLPKIYNFPEENLRAVLIELDKRDKVTLESLVSSLESIGMSKENANSLATFGSISGKPADVLEKIKDIFNNVREADEAVSDLENIAKTFESCNSEIIFDMGVIRGLGYYTGMVFEISLTDAPSFGSVCGGGRYDGLVESFGVRSLPAVGASIGTDRLIAALASLDFKTPEDRQKMIILVQDPTAIAYSFKVADKVRSSGAICEVYTGGKKKLSDQFDYADKLKYDHTIILGSNEVKDNTVTLRNQKTKSQEVLNFSDLKI